MFAHRFEPQGRRFRNVHYYYYYHVSACVQPRLSRQTPLAVQAPLQRQQSTDQVPVLFSKTTIERLGSVQLEARVSTHVSLSGPLRLSKWAELFRGKSGRSVKIAAFPLWFIKLLHYSYLSVEYPPQFALGMVEESLFTSCCFLGVEAVRSLP